MNNEDKKYTQIITTDGTKMRFFGRVVGINPDDIAHQKVLTDEEVLMIPEIKSGKMVMVDNSEAQATAIALSQEKSAIIRKIEDKKRQMAIDACIADGEISQADIDKIEG